MFAKSTNEKPESIKRVEKVTGRLVIFYEVDICNKSELHKIFKLHKIDCVIHLAAFKYVGESVKTPLAYYVNNISTSLVLLEVMQECRVKKLIFSSSSNVYGNPKFLPVTEDHCTGQNCTNPYGRSKYFVEEILKDVCTSDPDWRVILLRYFAPSGAHRSGLIGEDPLSEHLNLIPCIAQVAAGQRTKIKIFGQDYNTRDGTCIRDYTHVTDIADGHVKALKKISEDLFKGWTAYNLAAGKGYTVLEIIKIFEKVAKRNIKYELFDRRTVGRSWQDDDLKTVKTTKVVGKRYIVLHAGNKNGFIPGADLVFSSSTKNSDYHGEMNQAAKLQNVQTLLEAHFGKEWAQHDNLEWYKNILKGLKDSENENSQDQEYEEEECNSLEDEIAIHI
ncbi:hypothetical protein RN001_001899 [Aquatica leii]|uniref:UDP-N-acetylglucosamine 4-epimerase n=1 Tax=Aquatica leii TaxID=1421715 RepID=A0AAN7SR22_9COLE|nr:hypothetical protein RN001_001899 [Aquatica leii]